MRTDFHTSSIQHLNVSQRAEFSLQNLKFGTKFSDHVLHVEHAVGQGWGTPKIVPFGFIPVHPAAQVFPYGMSAFEGVKP